MAKSLNEVTLIGNLGKDPEIRSMQSGDRVANLSIATSESWKDSATGEKRERTEWHRVSVFSQGLVKVIEQYLKKGDKVYIKGQLETRSYEQDGVKKYTTEVVLRPFNSKLLMLSGKKDSGSSYDNAGQEGYNDPQTSTYSDPSAQQEQGAQPDEYEDEIPF